MAQTLQNTLYLLTPGLSVKRDGLAIRIEQNGELKLSLPVHNLESVFVFGPEIYLSPAVMRLCWENDASVCFFTDWGRLEARVEGVPKGSVLLRRAQHAAASESEKAAAIARCFVAGKIHNTRWLMLRSARDSKTPADAEVFRATADSLATGLRELERCSDLDGIRGIEGRAAAHHFGSFSLHLRETVREKFPIDGRNRRPPRDAVNCLLSFLYALLRHDCVSALTATGLDPFVGYLHADRSGRESLALDLMEEFRPWVDRIAITLLNRGELGADNFTERDGGAFELTEKGRKTIVGAYQQRKTEEVVHPLFKQKVRHAQFPFIQARLLARAIRSESPDYSPHLFT